MPLFSEAFKKHHLYSDFVQVKLRLQKHGFVCWLAGGAVRDLLLQRATSDFDLVTDATTENLKLIFPEALGVGEKFGVFKLILTDGNYFDVTTFREESDYVDGRRPLAVSASTPVQDALRRDFTVNALFWNDETQNIIDYVGGLSDLQNKTLRCVGSASVRFQEDHLRLLRLARFAAQLNFEVEAQTLKAAQKHTELIQKISGERIWSELKKISESGVLYRAVPSDLFSLLFEQIFKTQLKKNISLLNKSDDLFYLLAQSQTDTLQAKKILAERLHAAKEEVRLFDLFSQFQNHFLKAEINELAFETENVARFDQVLLYFENLRLIAPGTFNKVMELLKKFPTPLISGADLVQHVKPSSIKGILKQIRLRQFTGEIQTKSQALALAQEFKN